MPTLLAKSALPFPPEVVFAWHARPGAFERLCPPWLRSRVVSTERDFSSRVLRFEIGRGPFLVNWTARHENVRDGVQFTDVMLRGPMRAWRHTHHTELAGAGSTLADEVAFEPPAGRVGWRLARSVITRDLARLFAFRHVRTALDLARLADLDQACAGKPLRVAISGLTGAIGSQLAALLTTGGHTVVPLVRIRPQPGEVLWQPGPGPRGGQLDPAELEGLDAIIHLAGEPVLRGRWTPAKLAAIRDSRVDGTRLFAHTIAALSRPPKAFIIASATGIYGDRGEQELTEDAGVGSGFFAEVARDWENAAEPARQAGVRIAHLRLGMVLDPRSGLLSALRLPFSLGLGAIPGRGAAWWPWISMDDCLGAILHVLATPALSGPINIVAPGSVRSLEFAHELAGVLDRAVAARIPAWAISNIAGERATMMLASTRVAPEKLRFSGFRFVHPALAPALRFLLGRVMPDEVGMHFELR